MKFKIIFLWVLVIICGFTVIFLNVKDNQNKLEIEDRNEVINNDQIISTSSDKKESPTIYNVSIAKTFLQKDEIDSCIVNILAKEKEEADYLKERDCFTRLAYNNLDYHICEKMPEGENYRPSDRMFCLGFLAAMTGDLRICRDQKSVIYQNGCEYVVDKFWNNMHSFDKLAKEYKNPDSTDGLLSEKFLSGEFDPVPYYLSED